MKPIINATEFGYITVQGKKYDFDIIIFPSGQVIKRKKKLSKRAEGTSHIVSIEEVEDLYVKGVRLIIIGSGQYGVLKLSERAGEFFKQKGCEVKILSTPDAIKTWNIEKAECIGLFHTTC